MKYTRRPRVHLRLITSIAPMTGRFGGRFWLITLECGHSHTRATKYLKPRMPALDWCGGCQQAEADEKAAGIREARDAVVRGVIANGSSR